MRVTGRGRRGTAEGGMKVAAPGAMGTNVQATRSSPLPGRGEKRRGDGENGGDTQFAPSGTGGFLGYALPEAPLRCFFFA